MPFTVIFGCLELKKRASKIQFPKSIIYSDVVLDKLGQSYKSFVLSKNGESSTHKVSDAHSYWQVAGLQNCKTFELLKSM